MIIERVNAKKINEKDEIITMNKREKKIYQLLEFFTEYRKTCWETRVKVWSLNYENYKCFIKQNHQN